MPEIFTREDYFKYREDPEWWKYIYCLSKMSFSGVFRYSKNKFNVDCKKMPFIKVHNEFQNSLKRWKELNPTVFNLDYTKIDINLISNKVLVLDPPYETSQASYNKNPFNYKEYWEYVNDIKNQVSILFLFDKMENLDKQKIPIYDTRKMRVNGKEKGNTEALAIFENGKWKQNYKDFCLF